MKIFAIETSCDETALALVEATGTGFRVHKNIVSSQALLHASFGGVVPELAARTHLETLQPLLDEHIGRAAIRAADLIAVTLGPGLITSLMVGVQAAKTLSCLFSKPLIGINHMEGHIYSNWLASNTLFQKAQEYFPALVLVVSGGHTQLVLMNGHGQYELMGETADDAAGESFDKVAKLLDLGYPGGPVISKLARAGNPHAIEFPRPMIDSPDLRMSFSGLKTAVLYYLQKQKTVAREELPDIAASFQQAVVDLLLSKVRRAIQTASPRSLLLAGGVSANDALRAGFKALGDEARIPVFVPDLMYTGDNAAMIAAAAYYQRKRASRSAWKTLGFDPQLRYAHA